MAQENNIPSLRFPEFEEIWDVNKLGDLVEIKSGSSPSNYVLEDNGNYPFIKVEELNNTDKYQTISRFYSDSEDNLIPSNAIIFPKRGAAILNNKVRINSIPVLMDTNLMGLICDKHKLDYEFLFYKITKEKLYRIADTSTLPQLNNKHIVPYKVIIPSLPEQQKIASFLTSVDTKIEQLTKKKNLLEEYKKGVMQKIFSQEIRFKDENGNDYPDWKEKTFRELYSFHSTNSLSREKLNYESGEVLNIHYGDVHSKYRSLFDVEKEEVPFINSDIELLNIKDDAFCRVGDLVITDASEDNAGIGKAIEIINLKSSKVIAGLHTFLARPKLKMALGYAGQMLKVWNVRKQIVKEAQGAKVLGLSTGRLGRVNLPTPCYEEQAKIADYLRAIDDKMVIVSTQLEKTQQFKKGLLQQMFV